MSKLVQKMFVGGLLLAVMGCAQQTDVSQPETFAPPPDRSEQKGDNAPGPP